MGRHSYPSLCRTFGAQEFFLKFLPRPDGRGYFMPPLRGSFNGPQGLGVVFKSRPFVDILTEIITTKRQRVAAAKNEIPVELLREQAVVLRGGTQPHELASALNKSSRLNIIAEFKRRSPSKGLIRSDADASSIASAYERGGAAAISVLTEEDYFEGSLADLFAVRAAVHLPILRKDFIVDEYQVYESAAAGADALLLIVAALSDDELNALRELTENELGMDALIEVHTEEELQRALATGAKLIGVNNRNLRTFEVSLETSVDLAGKVPEDIVLVSESGLHSAADLHRLKAHGYKGFLIGETLMRSEEPELTLQSLIGSTGQRS